MPIEERIVSRLDELIEKGDEVLGTHKPNPPNVIGFPTLASGRFAEWQTQVESFLITLLGQEHVYVQNFRGRVQEGFRSHVHMGQGILRAVKEDILGGYVSDLKTLVSAEIFTDFLEMAEHLSEYGYKDPAASLCGAVLEDGLRRIASNAGIKLKSREDLSSLNHKCADAGVYNRLIQKKIQVWIDVRNSADHGQFDEYTAQDVEEMLKGVNQFLSDFVR
jgi:hypothetical protein